MVIHPGCTSCDTLKSRKEESKKSQTVSKKVQHFSLTLNSVQSKPVNRFPVDFYVNDNSYSKGKTSSETKMGRMEDPTFATPVHEDHWEIAIYGLWRKGRRDYRFYRK